MISRVENETIFWGPKIPKLKEPRTFRTLIKGGSLDIIVAVRNIITPLSAFITLETLEKPKNFVKLLVVKVIALSVL